MSFKGLKVLAVGGHGEIGRNCTALQVDDEIVLFDLGLHLDNYVRVTQDEDLSQSISKRLLIKEEAIPDISVLDKKSVKAVLISHAHLDHVGAVPFLGNSFSADIHGTPFTVEVARRLLADKRTELRNDLVAHGFRERFSVSDSISVEFIEVTHSTPQSAAIVVYTPYGNVVYLNDFKLDDNPLIGSLTDIDSLKAVNPRLLIIDTLYGDVDAHTESESFARQLLMDALVNRDLKNRNVLVTTFSSHVARLETLRLVAQKMGRVPVFIGRSMAKYLDAARAAGISNIISEEKVIAFGSKLRKELSKLINDSKDYLFVVTGGQAEPKAVLSRIIDDSLIPLGRGDLVVFSNKVIPTPSIIEARERLEKRLMLRGFEVLRDLHVSGHGSGKDHELILKELKPEFVVPVHGSDSARKAFLDRALNLGWSSDKVLLLKNGDDFFIG